MGHTASTSYVSKLERKATLAMGLEPDSVKGVTKKRVRGKLKAFMDNPSDPC